METSGLHLPNVFTDPFYNPPDSKTPKSPGSKPKKDLSNEKKKDGDKKDKKGSSSDEEDSAPPTSVSYYAALSTTLSNLVSECQSRLTSLEDSYYNESSTPFSIHLGAPSGSSAVTVTQHNGCWGGGGVWGNWSGFVDVKVPGGQDVIELVHIAPSNGEGEDGSSSSGAAAAASPPRAPRWSAGDYMSIPGSGSSGSTVYVVKPLAHSSRKKVPKHERWWSNSSGSR